MDRREFLGRAAWAVTAAAMGGAAKAAPTPGEASLVGFVAPKLEKIRVGVIGIGGHEKYSTLRYSNLNVF